MKGNHAWNIRNRMMLATILIAGIHLPVRADTQMNIQGNIKTSPCVVDGDTANGISVSLGEKIQANTLSQASSSGSWSAFNLKLTDCPTTVTSAIATFSGSQANESATLYENTGDARNVQIELQSQTGTNLGNGQTMSQPVNSADHTILFPLQARVYSFAGGAKSGSILGAVEVNFTYP